MRACFAIAISARAGTVRTVRTGSGDVARFVRDAGPCHRGRGCTRDGARRVSRRWRPLVRRTTAASPTTTTVPPVTSPDQLTEPTSAGAVVAELVRVERALRTDGPDPQTR